MINVSISGHKKIRLEHDKSYTVFVVLVQVGIWRHTVEKRYTEFEKLHKKLKTLFETPEFPPKKVMKWNLKVLEQRRQGLESYLQTVVECESPPKVLLKFLDIHNYTDGSTESLSDDNMRSHQPMIAFSETSFLHEETGGLLDIVTTGAVQGIYS